MLSEQRALPIPYAARQKPNIVLGYVTYERRVEMHTQKFFRLMEKILLHADRIFFWVQLQRNYALAYNFSRVPITVFLIVENMSPKPCDIQRPMK